VSRVTPTRVLRSPIASQVEPRMLTLRPEEVEEVAQAVARYRKSVNDLAAEAQVELDELVARVRATRASDRQ